ncbi:hypothetical protein HK405_006872 [Cladochytrium tenue]|nr:hypothetical protein HK405_006872 [Cladochytrium tenue]
MATVTDSMQVGTSSTPLHDGAKTHDAAPAAESSPAFVVVITGCSDGGIGSAFARAFATAAPPPESSCSSIRVFATARRIDAMSSLSDLPNVTFLSLDVTDSASVMAAVEAITATVGRVDMLVNNAGKGCYGPLLEIPDAAIIDTITTNAIAPVAVTRAFLPLLLRQAANPAPGVPPPRVPVARIVNVGSVADAFNVPFGAVYAMSKAALHMATDGLRLELRPFGVSVCHLRIGAVTSNFGSTSLSTGVHHDPATSRYNMFDVAASARGHEGHGASSAPEFAQDVVRRTLRNGYLPAQLTLGMHSGLITFMGRLPYWITDGIMTREFLTPKKSEPGPQATDVSGSSTS